MEVHPKVPQETDQGNIDNSVAQIIVNQHNVEDDHSNVRFV